MEERMSQLKFGSLVDLTPQAAVWIVIGSTKKPYKVSIGDLNGTGQVASKCGCMDFRLRKRGDLSHRENLCARDSKRVRPRGCLAAVHKPIALY